MSAEWWIAQALAVIAMVICFLSYQGNSKKHILSYQIFSALLFGISDMFLMFNGENALTGVALNAIGVIKGCVFVYALKLDEKKSKRVEKIAAICLVASYITVCVLTWEGWLSLFPVLAMSFTTLAFLLENPKIIRYMHVPSSPCWLVYDISIGNIPAILTEIFNLVSLAIAIVRFDVLKQGESKKKRS